jgi:hypothetical protein
MSTPKSKSWVASQITLFPREIAPIARPSRRGSLHFGLAAQAETEAVSLQLRIGMASRVPIEEVQDRRK